MSSYIQMFLVSNSISLFEIVLSTFHVLWLKDPVLPIKQAQHAAISWRPFLLKILRLFLAARRSENSQTIDALLLWKRENQHISSCPQGISSEFLSDRRQFHTSEVNLFYKHKKTSVSNPESSQYVAIVNRDKKAHQID